MTTILLTRSVAENATLKEELRSYDFTYVDCPLIEYEDIGLPHEILKSYSHIIITSKYAAKILANHFNNIRTSFKFWIVGELSAEILLSSGLQVEYIADDVNDLIVNLPKYIYKDAIYLSANEITLELPLGLERYIIYNVKYRQDFTKREVELLNRGFDYIMLYSQNSATTLVKILQANNLYEKLQNATVIAISLKVAKEVLPYSKKIIYCEKGEHKKMTELLISHATKTGK